MGGISTKTIMELALRE